MLQGQPTGSRKLFLYGWCLSCMYCTTSCYWFRRLIGGKAYSASDRSAGYVNFLLGSTHITEGAIPFAAKKPLKVIPILMLGSSIAAILTYLFKVQVPAPHGGFIVLPIVTHAILWVVAILIGAIVSGFLMSMDQKRTVAKNKKLIQRNSLTPLAISSESVNRLRLSTRYRKIFSVMSMQQLKMRCFKN